MATIEFGRLRIDFGSTSDRLHSSSAASVIIIFTIAVIDVDVIDGLIIIVMLDGVLIDVGVEDSCGSWCWSTRVGGGARARPRGAATWRRHRWVSARGVVEATD
jgi:hypothetical protein